MFADDGTHVFSTYIWMYSIQSHHPLYGYIHITLPTTALLSGRVFLHVKLVQCCIYVLRMQHKCCDMCVVHLLSEGVPSLSRHVFVLASKVKQS
jgi:hypothetical protein